MSSSSSSGRSSSAASSSASSTSSSSASSVSSSVQRARAAAVARRHTQDAEWRYERARSGVAAWMSSLEVAADLAVAESVARAELATTGTTTTTTTAAGAANGNTTAAVPHPFFVRAFAECASTPASVDFVRRRNATSLTPNASACGSPTKLRDAIDGAVTGAAAGTVSPTSTSPFSRATTFGTLHHTHPNDKMLQTHLFSYFLPRDLVVCSQVSWGFYAAATDETLWRTLALLYLIDEKAKVGTFCFHGSWRATVLHPARFHNRPWDQQVRPPPPLSVAVGPPVPAALLSAHDATGAVIDGATTADSAAPPPPRTMGVVNPLSTNSQAAAACEAAPLATFNRTAFNWRPVTGAFWMTDAPTRPRYSFLWRTADAQKWYDMRTFDTIAAPMNLGTIDRRAGLTLEQFIEEYERPNVPVVLTDHMQTRRWAALDKWRVETLASHYAELPLKTNSRTTKGHRFRIRTFDYLAYCHSCRGEEKFIYIFDKKCFWMYPKLGSASLLADYEVPRMFQQDLFAWMREEDRPDYRWFLLGPNGSGSPYHQDPHRTSAWNAVTAGVKRVSFYPPHIIPPGVDPELLHTDYYASDDMMQWYRNTMPQCVRKVNAPNQSEPGSHSGPAAAAAAVGSFALGAAADSAGPTPSMRYNARDTLRLKSIPAPVECLVYPGELIFIPSGWWHQIMNIGTTIAVTQNYISTQTWPFAAPDINEHGGLGLRNDLKAALAESPYAALAQDIRVFKKRTKEMRQQMALYEEDVRRLAVAQHQQQVVLPQQVSARTHTHHPTHPHHHPNGAGPQQHGAHHHGHGHSHGHHHGHHHRHGRTGPNLAASLGRSAEDMV